MFKKSSTSHESSPKEGEHLAPHIKKSPSASSSWVTPPAKESVYYTASELRKVMGELGFAVSHVRGASMRPLMWGGCHYAVIVPLEGEAQIGDLLVFEHIRRNSTSCIVHRLVGIDRASGTDIYITRGDNCVVCERIRKEDIIGRVAEVYRIGGWRPWHALPTSHFTLQDKAYRLYSALWLHTFPLRKSLYRLRALLSR